MKYLTAAPFSFSTAEERQGKSWSLMWSGVFESISNGG